MTTEKRDALVDRLLHDAEHADSGYAIAKMMKDKPAMEKFREKYEMLLAEANAVDPQQDAPAWIDHAEWEMEQRIIPA